MANNQQEKERLKQIYKDHYRQIRELKDQYQQNKRKASMLNALKDMDNSELMNSMNEFIDRIKSRIAQAEARLEVALENVDDDVEAEHAKDKGDSESTMSESQADLEQRKEEARKSLKRIKAEMGELYSELEKQAGNMDVEKTVGKADADTDSSGSTDAEENEEENSGTGAKGAGDESQYDSRRNQSNEDHTDRTRSE